MQGLGQGLDLVEVTKRSLATFGGKGMVRPAMSEGLRPKMTILV